LPSAAVQRGHISFAGLSPLAIGAAASVAIHAGAIAVLSFDQWSSLLQPRQEQAAPRGEPVRVRLTRPDRSELAPLLGMMATDMPLETARPRVAKRELPVVPRTDVRLQPTGRAANKQSLHAVDAQAIADHPPIAPSVPPPEIALTAPVLEMLPEASPPPSAPEQPVGVEQGVEIVKMTEPLYPERSLRNGEQGDVLVLVEVLVDGAVGRVTVHESSGHTLLDRAALRAARRCRFEPARRNGEPVTSEILVPFEFRIRG
jgi:protein TonB